jgi:rhamnulokinase
VKVSGRSFLAVDLGAESGRTILGSLKDARLEIKELSRFENGMLPLLGHWHWNIFRLFEEMKKGLRAAGCDAGTELQSMALDTWGVDFALLAPDGSILGLPYAYRDPQTDGAMEAFFERMPRERVYKLTGIQFMQFNSLFQLFALKRRNSPLLEAAGDLLFMPDVFNYLFTGEKKTEFTYATTSQLYNPVKKTWEDALFEALGVPPSIMQDIVQPGTVIGELEQSVCREAAIDALPMVAAASHDTGSAVAAVPAEEEDWAYISSGTWSLMGVETKAPILTKKALESNFTNEGGVEGTIRFLKNITGLWLLQQCKKRWEKDRAFGYGELMELARSVEPFKALVDPDRRAFLHPPDMTETIRTCCAETGQAAPETPAQFVRGILESLALKYRLVLDQLKEMAPRPIRRIHVIGGGARNELLCQFTANATGLPVLAGPVEATAIGNIMVQAIATGAVRSLAEMRGVIRGSFEIKQYEPERREEWEAAYRQFHGLCTS